ncbi:bifunctional serine/threonine-protein kinase/formylglycine-generating enzyme family protein [Stigmatella aurantiaca]|uniref:Serine/threonine protein kinase n=2 Tax=Stigmatella aurantiaca TaxID=41 RepID=E3FXX2_STIAD|nr:bifunctional serine/threonine-protein kinase/formylglycine-generating enzyme family protein [Stigmatella aurantiaca]ADO76101.1 serine/threonine protein kinase [Stigmatella aurantiaca DW4/3-1]
MGEYRLLRLLGRGGMGQVYLAEDTLLERTVALKLIASVRPDEAARKRFHAEARAIARLSHPNVVTVHRVGEVDGRPYLVTEFIRGQTLGELARPIAPERVLTIALGLARGLAAAHRQGVLHRDIKPANAMLTEDGEVKLLDFGLAKLLEGPRMAPLEAPARAAPPVPALRELSDAEDLMGTPLYMAPEALRGEPSTRRSDLYSLGAVLYELCAGIAPRQTLDEQMPFEAWASAEPTPLPERVKDVDPRFAALVTRCLHTEPERRFASADELCAALSELKREREQPPEGEVPEGNPYRGLRPFEAEHRAFFFGRSMEVEAVLERLRAEPLVLVTGDSGVGKSSLCRAGVLPRVAEGALGPGRHYRTLSLIPGARPLAALASATESLLEKGEALPSELLRTDPRAFVRELLRTQGRQAGTLLFVDQLEELFTIGAPEEAAPFAEGVVRLSDLPGVRVLLTVRGDFFTRLASLPGLGEQVARALYLLRPLSAEAARGAIVGPAQSQGIHFESEALVSTLAESAVSSAGGLPLLQFAMAELWEARDEARRCIPASALEALGGVDGALSRHADRVLAGLQPEQRRAARALLPRLVSPEGTGARRSGAELDAGEPATQGALDALVKGRLVVARETDGETTYEVAHEALLRGWGTLRSWLVTEGEKRPVRERLEAAAAEWARLERTREALWSERLLLETQGVDRDALSPRGTEFLDASHSATRRRRWRQRALLMAVPLALVLALGGVRLQAQWTRARKVAWYEAQATGLTERGLARKQAAEALRLRAHGLFEAVGGGTVEETAARRESAERAWEEALTALHEADDALDEAGQSLEAALVVDLSNDRVRGRIVDVLIERLELAESFHQQNRLRELTRRIRAYDSDGLRQERLQAPPELSLTSSPSGAEVVLERYQEDAKGYRTLSGAQRLGRTPLAKLVLEEGPGSYRLTLHAPGHVPVQAPVLLGRGEHLPLHVPLPAEGAVPEGFVYVPPGRFLVGSAEPEDMRRGLLNAPPLHESQTGGFLVARTEVTFGQWLEFLRDESPGGLAQGRRPYSDVRQWGVELTPAASGRWRLTFQLNKRSLSASEGEPLLFPGRAVRREQDWSRLPVSGISFEDARAYLAWLNRTGRVPGARFCHEREWERAARGADGRAFPHGNRLEAEDANFDQTYGRKTDAFGPDEVGSHPASASPFGLLDMTGNVYEFTLSMGAREEIAIRGGSWYFDRVSVLAANRTFVEPRTRDIGTGMRVCADAPAVGP